MAARFLSSSANDLASDQESDARPIDPHLLGVNLTIPNLLADDNDISPINFSAPSHDITANETSAESTQTPSRTTYRTARSTRTALAQPTPSNMEDQMEGQADDTGDTLWAEW